MTNENYANRVASLLSKKEMDLSEDKIMEYAVIGNSSGLLPHEIVRKIKTKEFGPRKARADRAAVVVAEVVQVCCDNMDLDSTMAVDYIDSSDWRDLRSLVCHVCVNHLELSPKIIVSNALGMKSPAMAYTLAARGKKLADERVIFHQQFNTIISSL